jgi:hypothetical protein
MAKKCIWLITLVPLLASVASVPASACNVVGHSSSGEPLCATTSDGAGQPYSDARSWRVIRQERLQRANAARYQI